MPETVNINLKIALPQWFQLLTQGFNKKLNQIIMTLQERFNEVIANQNAAKEQLNTTGTKLGEASAEIVEELRKLRAMELPPEAEASLAVIEANAKGTKDMSDALAATAATMAEISPPVEGGAAPSA